MNRRRDTQHNDTQHNDTQYNDTQYNDTQYNDTQNNDTQNNDTQHNDTQHINILCPSAVMLDKTFFILMLSVSFLNYYADFRYTECHKDKSVIMRFAILSVVIQRAAMLSVIMPAGIKAQMLYNKLSMDSLKKMDNFS